MAKLAVVFFAALAFQAALAGVFRTKQHQKAPEDYEHGQVQSYQTGLEDLLDRLQNVAQDMNASFQTALPHDRQVVQALTWQSRELAQYVDTVVEKLQVEANQYHGKTTIAIEQVVRELRDIQTVFHRIATYTDVTNIIELKNQFNTYVQKTVEQIEKLVRLVQTDLEGTQGNLYAIVKSVVIDFLTAFQNIHTQVHYFGVQGGFTPRQLAAQIQEVTSGLTDYFQGTYFNIQEVKPALRQYVKYVEAVMTRLQEVEDTIGNVEFHTVVQQVYNRLRKVVVLVKQVVDVESIEKVDVLKHQLVKEFQTVAQEIEQLVQYAQTGTQQTLIQEVLRAYLYAIQQVRIYIQGRYQDQTDYQGLYKYGGLFGQTGYQGELFGKYHGLAKYGQTGKGLAIQIQVVVDELTQTLQFFHGDDVVARQTFVKYIREYVQELETIVEKLQQAVVDYKVEVGVYTPKQTIQELRQIVVSFQHIYTAETSVVELRRKFVLYVQRFASELQKLTYDVQQTKGQFYNVIRDALVQFLTVTRSFQNQIQNFYQTSQVGQYDTERDFYGRQYYGGKYFGGKYGQYYGEFQGRQSAQTPRELFDEIQVVYKHLSAFIQNAPLDNQQILTVQVRHFAQIVKNIIDQLEEQLNENADTVVQQVVYKLREMYSSLKQLAVYNTFTNVHQMRAEFNKYIEIAVAQIERLFLVAHEKTQGHYYVVIKNVLYMFSNCLQDMYYQFQDAAHYGKGYGYGFGYGYGDKYGKVYGYGKGYGYGKQYAGQYGDSYNQGYGFHNYGQYYGGFQGRQYAQTPKAMFDEIQVVYKHLSAFLQSAPIDNQQAFTVQVRHFTQIIKNIIDQLEGQLNEEVDTVFQQVVYKLREVYSSLKQLAVYNTFTNVYQMKAEFDKYIQIAVEQMEKLLVIAHENTQGHYYVVIKGVFNIFFNGLQDVYYQFQDVAHYGKGYGYGFGYGDKYGKVYGYGKGYGYGKQYTGQYDDLYNQGYGFHKYGQGYGYGKYGQGYGYGKYGQGYGYGKYAQKYGQEYGYGKYAQKYGQEYGLQGQYGKGYGYGKYGQEYGYGKYDQEHGFDKYGQGYGYGKYGQRYGQEYGFGKYGQGYGQEYGLQSQYGKGYGYGKYGQEYGFGKYGQGYGFQGRQYGYGLQGGKYQTKTVEQLANQIQIVANQVADELQTVAINDKQIRQVFIVQARQFVQIIDNIYDRLQAELTYDNREIVQEVISNLRQIRVQLQQIVNSGVITTVYQMKVQIAKYIQAVAVELQKLSLVAQSDFQQAQIVKDVLVQYITYLRNVQYQLQYNAYGYQNTNKLASQLQYVASDLSDSLRDAPYNPTQAREYAQRVQHIYNRLQQLYGDKVQEYPTLRQFLYKLAQIIDSIQQESDSGVTYYNVRLGNDLQDAADKFQEYIVIAQPQLAEDGLDILVFALLGDFLDATQNFHDTIRAY